MATTSPRAKLLVIVGPTASGKSELAIRLAKQFKGEIITADSRTIYKGMNIGTAKPNRADRQTVPHWGLDLVEPGEIFSAARFKKYAEDKIKGINQRHKLPILVGGTGLYIDSVLFDFSFIKRSRFTAVASRLIYSSWSIEKLQKIIQQRDWQQPQNWRNRRHLIRTIERKGQIGSQKGLNYDALIIGLNPEAKILKQAIHQRVERIFKEGVVKETESLYKQYGPKMKKTAGIVYLICLRVLESEITLEQAKEEFEKADWRYARRQRTWFKRNKTIKWFAYPDQAYRAAVKQLNN